MRSNNQDGSLGTRKDVSDDLRGEEAKADPYNESGNKVVEILKNSAESRSRFIFIHSKEAKSGRNPNEEERRDEDDDSEREESESVCISGFLSKLSIYFVEGGGAVLVWLLFIIAEISFSY